MKLHQMLVAFLFMTSLTLTGWQTSNAAELSLSTAPSTSQVHDDIPPSNKHTQACSRIATPENVEWFRQLIALNPDAFVHTVGQGICVTNPEGQPLTLPMGPVPDDVFFNY